MKYSTSPAYSFTHTKKLDLPNEDPLHTPGPQKYTPNKLLIHHPSAIMGTEKKYPTNIKIIPGPGAYQIPSLFPKGYKYSIGKSFMKDNYLSTPGPSTYHPLKKSKSCFYSFGLKGKEQITNTSPGPGKYNLRKNKDLIKSSYIFGKEKRAVTSNVTYNTSTPGPGNYKYSHDGIKIRYPKYSFGKEERKNKDNNINPGPGTYKYKEFVGKEGKKISMSKKLKNLEDTNNIGPGQYNHTDLNFYKTKSPSTKIGKTKRFDLSPSKENLPTPGPADYDNHIKYIPTLKKKEPRCNIGTAKRRFSIDINKYIPGPGKYNIAKITGKETPFYSMGLKTKIIKDHLNPPGPGKYDVEKANVFEHHPTWKMGTEPKIKPLISSRNTPGVGTYTINLSRNFRPKFGYTKEKRGYLTINDFPGPGAYHIPCSFEELNTYTRRTGKFNDEFRYI